MKNRKTKILLCITLPDNSGEQRVVYDIIACLDPVRFDITGQAAYHQERKLYGGM